MPDSVWTSEDPQPGDLDDVLDTLDPEFIEDNPGNPGVTVRMVVEFDEEDTRRIERISAKRGEGADKVIPDLLRDAERTVA